MILERFTQIFITHLKYKDKIVRVTSYLLLDMILTLFYLEGIFFGFFTL